MQTIILIIVEEQTSYLQMTEENKNQRKLASSAIQWIKDCFAYFHFHCHTAEINAFVSKYSDDLHDLSDLVKQSGDFF